MEEKQLFSQPEIRETACVEGQAVELLCYYAFVMEETKAFWLAKCRGITIASACDTERECLTHAKQYLKKAV